MNKTPKFPYATFLSLAGVLFAMLILLIVLVARGDVAVFNPKGWIALKQRDLITYSTLLMLIVVVPVLILTYAFAWIYRSENRKAKYLPNWAHSTKLEMIWWGFPCAILLVLGVVIWKSSHELDPFKPLQSDVKPLRIQVVALDWKWLFIYPEQNIATINYIQFPEKRPLNFEITADAPMNSFWIPQLGGQIYAMPGMRSKLHLIADEMGSFRGSSANLSGAGFAGMTFTAKASSQEEFDDWVHSVESASETLTLDAYQELVLPTQNHPVTNYVLAEDDLFEKVLMKYMTGMH